MQESMNEMRQIRFDKLDALIQEGRDPHTIEHFRDRTLAKEILENFEIYEEKPVRIAGRILSKRGHGKVVFAHILDATDKIQLFLKADHFGDAFEEIKSLDIGDIIGAEGEVFKTKTGEISIRAKEVTLLTKSLAILPEKFHGLKDVDLRYRQRYVDLIMNPEVRHTFYLRSRIITEIRNFLDDRGFLEVETPILSTVAGGAAARPFITHHNTLDIDMYLRIANELYLKRLIVGGFDKVYELGRMFRNEGMDQTHNPEYTAMELYQAYADYEDMMEITENLVATVAEKVLGTTKVLYGDTEIDFTPPWRRVTMQELIKEYTGVDFATIETDEEAQAVAKKHNLDLKKGNTRGYILNEMFEEFCEEHLVQPTFVIGHPVEVSPLAKRDPKDPRITHRFEAFVCTKEIANAFSELNDARDQRARFEEQVKMRESGDHEANMMDTDFVYALEVGLPPTGGLGIGIDRLIMFLTNHDSIRDVLLFPTMKPIREGHAQEQNQEVFEEVKEDEPIDFSKVQVEPLFDEYIDFEEFQKADYRAVKVIQCEEVPKSKKLLKFTLDDGSGKERTILSGIKQYYEPEQLIGKTLLAICNLPPRPMMGIESQGMLISAVHKEEDEERLNLLVLNPRIPAGAKMY